MVNHDQIIGLITAYGIGAPRQIAARPLDAQGFAEVLRRATEERLIGLLARAAVDGALACTEEQCEEISARECDAAGMALRIEAMVLDVACRLDREGLDYRVLKGVA